MRKLIYTILAIFFSSIIQISSQNDRPNILLITLDDMNWDSPGVYGGVIPNLTPHIDNLAKEGMLFENAYVQAPNCSPSRVVIQTGLYPHQSGIRGFFYAQPNGNTLPEILQEQNYFTGVLNKPADTSLSPDFVRYWDVSRSIQGADKRSDKSYANLLKSFLKEVNKRDKPFYCVVNIADPHKPFFNDPSSKKKGFDKFEPSEIFQLKDVQIPDFLPKNPKIKQEVLNYINSVKRGDDCVGAVLNVIKNSKFKENTVVILLSDHGAPFPFAKSSIYQNGVRTPLIVSWPGKIKNAALEKNMVSAIDLAPTILELVDVPIPTEFKGKSFYSALLSQEVKKNEFIFAQFDENAGGIPRPSRTIISKNYGYIFNPWATGKFVFKSASSSHLTFKKMKQMANNNQEVAQRFNHWLYRTVEELYDYENDPHALNNLIDNPEYKEVVDELRNRLFEQMEETNDYVLDAFQNRDNKEFLNSWMKQQIQMAEKRMTSLKWKRGKNSSGSTKTNKELFVINR